MQHYSLSLDLYPPSVFLYACRRSLFLRLHPSTNLVDACSFYDINKTCYNVNKRAYKLHECDAISNLLFDSWSIREQNGCLKFKCNSEKVSSSLLKFYPSHISRWKWDTSENFYVPLRIILVAYKFYSSLFAIKRSSRTILYTNEYSHKNVFENCSSGICSEFYYLRKRTYLEICKR